LATRCPARMYATRFMVEQPAGICKSALAGMGGGGAIPGSLRNPEISGMVPLPGIWYNPGKSFEE
jgi:hypothetical protein